MGRGTAVVMLILGTTGLLVTGWLVASPIRHNGYTCGSVVAKETPEASPYGDAEEIMAAVGAKMHCDSAYSSRLTYAFMVGLLAAAALAIGAWGLNQSDAAPSAPTTRAVIRPVAVAKSSSPARTVAIFTPDASIRSMNASNSFGDLCNRSGCHATITSTCPAFTASNIARYLGRGFPEYADTSLSVNTSATVHPCEATRASQSACWRATPNPLTVWSSRLIRA